MPRVQVEALPVDADLTDLVAASARTGHSRFPVFEEDLDDVVGVVHVKDVLRVAASARPTTRVGELMAEPIAVPETRSLERLFADLRQTGRQLAIVVDEHGGPAGIVTLEDLIEEIVGEIDDEYDPVTTTVRFDAASESWELAGTLHPDEVRAACGYEMPEGEYETLAGFVLDRLGHIPHAGEVVIEDGWRFEVTAMDRHRIATVLVARAAGAPVMTGADCDGLVPGRGSRPAPGERVLRGDRVRVRDQPARTARTAGRRGPPQRNGRARLDAPPLAAARGRAARDHDGLARSGLRGRARRRPRPRVVARAARPARLARARSPSSSPCWW